ncbi:MAG: PD-(D/E)XK nuclease family protein [Elusimicrobiota bacterium]|jgi:putative RecB family exonuclease|nr:PD-(D/E)XK nuclease family protein [Elusimicrobiota bacterium]
MTAKLSFSYSKLGLYKECPQKYKFRYILKVPEKPKYYFAFGNALHKVMEFIYSSGKPSFPLLETTLKFFKTDWDSSSFGDKGYENAAKEQEGFLEGVRIIKAYYEKHQSDNISPLSTEFRSTVHIDGLSVISVLDRIDYLGEGQISILDYKTGKTLSREPDQLMFYQKITGNNPQIIEMIKRKYPLVKEIKIANMLFYHLPTLREQSFEPASQKEIDAFWAGVLSVAGDILANKFNPDPSESKCRFCDYKAACPVWEVKGESNLLHAESENGGTINPQAELSQKIDSYGKILEECESLKKEITEIMLKNNFSKHFGQNYVAEIETKKDVDFKDHKKTIDFLKEQNLLPKVCVPTLSSICKLLESGDITPPQKKTLRDMSIAEESASLNIKKTGK